MRDANLHLLDEVHALLNRRKFHFVHYTKEGQYCLMQRQVDGISYRVEFGPDRAIAIVVNIANLEANVFVFSMSEYFGFENSLLPKPFFFPYPHSLANKNPIEIAKELEETIIWFSQMDAVVNLRSQGHPAR